MPGKGHAGRAMGVDAPGGGRRVRRGRGFLGPALLLGQLRIGELYVDAAIYVDALCLLRGGPLDGLSFALGIRLLPMPTTTTTTTTSSMVIPRRRRKRFEDGA